MVEGLAFWLAVAVLAWAALAGTSGLALRKEAWRAHGVRALAATLVPLGLALLLRWIRVEHGPYVTRFEVLASDAWMLVAVYLAAARWWRPAAAAGVLVAPAALFMLGAAAMVTHESQPVPAAFDNVWLVVHILFAKAAYGSLLVSGGLAAVALWRRRQGADGEGQEEWSHRWMLAGFLFLALMIAAGSLWAYHAWGRYWGWDPIECWALATWLGYGVVVHLRFRGWRGPRFCWTSIAAVAAVGLAYFVAPTISGSIHAGYFQ